VARVSLRALTANARAAVARGIRHYPTSVLAADAWGHGERLVRGVLEAEGLVSSDESTAALDGASLYGLPQTGAAGRTVLRLTGTVLSVKDLRAGEGVSYGFAYRAPADTRVALVTGGYAQGIMRALGGAVQVAIAGERHPIVGRVAMDVCVVEISDAAVRRGDGVLFLGDPTDGEPSLADWIEATGLSSAELVTTVGLRAFRVEAA
jgi:alanine racemase